MLTQRLLCLLIFLVMCLSGLQSSIFSQTAVGIQAEGTYDSSDVDHINLADLSVHIDIPLFTHKDRGLLKGAEAHIVYDTAYRNNGTTYINDAGWRIVAGTEVYGFVLATQTRVNVQGSNCQAYYTFSFIDPTGYLHRFGGEVTENICGGNRGQPSTTLTAYAGDGTGYLLTVRALTAYSPYNPPATVTTPSGLKVSYSGLPVVDTNGNEYPASVSGSLPGIETMVDNSGVSIGVTKAENPTSPNSSLYGSAYNTSTVNGYPAITSRNPSYIQYQDSTGTLENIVITYKMARADVIAGNDSDYFDTGLVDAITYPDGTAYHFSYAPSGDLTSMQLPTGGNVSYVRTKRSSTPAYCVGTESLTRSTMDGSATYSGASYVTGDDNCPRATVTNIARDNGSELVSFVISTVPYTSDTMNFETAHTWYSSQSAPLSSSMKCYNGAVGDCTTNQVNIPVTQVSRSVSFDGQQPMKIVENRNALSLPTEVDEYDYGASAPMRVTTTKYALLGNNIADHPSEISVQDEHGVTISRTSFGYDESSVSVTTGLAGHAAVTGPRGNKTSQRDWLNTTNSTLDSHWAYDDAGQTISVANYNGNLTTYQHDALTDNCTVKVIPPSPPSGVSESRSATCNSYTGLPETSTDANGIITNYLYDGMLRIKEIDATTPTGGNALKQINDYSGASLPETITTSLQAAPNPTQVSTTTLDGLGRISSITSPSGFRVDRTYDSAGLLQSISNGFTNGITSFLYDVLKRKTMQCQPGNTNSPSTVCRPSGSYQSWMYNNNTVTFTDESGKQGQQTKDGLGRLVNVLESDGTNQTLSVKTEYSYDVLGNLTNVLQHGDSGAVPRTHSFTYDSLSRLITSANPETGTICYGLWSGSNCQNGYDPNGNLINKTDSLGVVTTYKYDALNRLIRKSYSDGTHTVGFGYDGFGDDGLTPVSMTSNSIGRLSHISNDVDAATSLGYDAMGRLSSEIFCLPSACDYSKTVLASYDLAGNLHTLAYPDGNIIEQIYDGAGHLSEVYGIDGQGNRNQSLLQPTSYHPDGSVHVLTLGNGIQQTIEKNNRLQISSMTVTDPFSNGTYLSHTYCYVNCATGSAANNGNIWGITDALNAAKTQGFTYDGLNRIKSFSLGGIVKQQYHTDSFGNMSLMVGGNPIFNFDPATNRISNLPCAASVAPYDAAGNQTCLTDPNGGFDFAVYDAENRITSVSTQSGGGSPFEVNTYGGDGSLARKQKMDNTYTEYVYFNGQPIAEKDQTGAWTNYVYANGQKIARIEPTDVRAHLSGVRPESSSVWGVYVIGTNYSYQIKPGDKVAFRMYQHNAIAGISLGFSDGDNSDHYCVPDGSGVCIDREPVADAWVNRTADLNGSVVGKTLTYIFLVNFPGAPAGSYDVELADLNIISTDGTITPFVNRDRTESLSGDGNTYRCGAVGANWHTDCRIERVSGSTTRFMLADHLGSASMELTAGGWPVSMGQYTPFGQEINPQNTGNQYKFTGKERDTESGLDHFEFRNYASTMGRWMSPDPRGNSVADFSNPQSWNMYSYVLNNPLKYVDPFGLDCAYLNDAGTGIESSDRNSSIGECGKTGGYYVSGAVNTLNVDNGGGYHFGYQGVAADGNYTTTTYDHYLGPNTDNSLSSAYGAAGSLLSDFLTGNGATVRNYDLSTVEGRNIMQSKGIQQLNARIKAGCANGQQSGPVDLSSGQAASNIPYDAANSPVGGQVGGYAGGTYTNNGDSTDISFTNVAGAHSFVYHATPDRPSGSTGSGRSIIQNFTLSEPNPCTHP